MSAAFGWRYLGATGSEVGSSEAFPDRETAEAWLAEAWADLRDRGVEEVELMDRDGDEPVYRMRLDEA